ncbi:hypothetical protein [Bathymodiolus japonicus methanotrophic gill symbiont]|nr:hypothetical protein [Bathymodiolus japonicus methanotrophic gill symbiont]
MIAVVVIADCWEVIIVTGKVFAWLAAIAFAPVIQEYPDIAAQ